MDYYSGLNLPCRTSQRNKNATDLIMRANEIELTKMDVDEKARNKSGNMTIILLNMPMQQMVHNTGSVTIFVTLSPSKKPIQPFP